jgi:DNA modification methylase
MNKIIFGDCRDTLNQLAKDGVKAQMCVTSPPYFGLRDYGVDGQLGQEQEPEHYLSAMVEVFRAVRDVLADDGTLWLNIGDSYGKGKQLLMIPARLALALQADGWVLRQDIIWHKPNPMPESVRDRCTKAHEYIFLLSKSSRYFFDGTAMQEDAIYGSRGSVFHKGKTADHQLGRASKIPRQSKVRGEFNGKTNAIPGREAFRAIRETRNKRSVWSVSTRPYKKAHFATFPSDLIEPCVLAGSRIGDIVLDPFMGSGTTAAVAIEHGRAYLGCELNQEYKQMQDERIAASYVKLSMKNADLFQVAA